MGRDTLHNLVEIVDEKEIETVYRILLKFVAEDAPLPDEVVAIHNSVCTFWRYSSSKILPAEYSFQASSNVFS